MRSSERADAWLSSWMMLQTVALSLLGSLLGSLGYLKVVSVISVISALSITNLANPDGLINVSDAKARVDTSSPTSPALSADQVERWFQHHRGTTRYSVTSRDGGKGSMWMSVERDSSGALHLWHITELSTFNGRNADHYRVTHRRFNTRRPFALDALDIYALNEGAARAMSWRADQTKLNTKSQSGLWIAIEDARELRRINRTHRREGARLAQALWSDHSQTKMKARPHTTRETIADHLDLVYASAPRRVGHQVIIDERGARDERFTVTRVDQRLTLRRGHWTTTQELKIVDGRGRSSSVVQDQHHKTLALYIGDQLKVISTAYRAQEVRSRTLTLLARGRFNRATASQLRKAARAATHACTTDQTPTRPIKARLHITSRGLVDEVSFDHHPTWGPRERCLANRLIKLDIKSRPTGGDVSIALPLML